MSETEVTNIRNPGDLVFSIDNEIMAVPLALNQTIVPGDVVVVGGTGNEASIATSTNIDSSKGVGVCIFEGGIRGATGSEEVLIQIATGNAYVVCKATGTIKPFENIKVGAVGATTQGSVVASLIPGTITATNLGSYVKETIGRSYGNPGEMVKPGNVVGTAAAPLPLVVRLGN